MLPPLESKLKMAACFRTVPQKKIPAVIVSSCPHTHFDRLFVLLWGCSSAMLCPRVSLSSIIFRLLLRLPQPSEEGRDRLESHALTLLLRRVFARLPLVEGVLGDYVLVVQTVKEHPEKVCRQRGNMRLLSWWIKNVFSGTNRLKLFCKSNNTITAQGFI